MKEMVTVIVPCYNKEEYIDECLTSIEKQTYENYEVIVVDNESTDNSRNIAEAYCIKNSWKFSTAKNLYEHSWKEPVTKAMDMMDAESKWFTILAVDDFIDPDYLSNVMLLISKSAKKGIKAIQTVPRNVGLKIQQEPEGMRYEQNLLSYKKALLEKCVVYTPTVFWSSELISDGFMDSNPEKYFGADDYFMYCAQADKGLLIYSFPKRMGYNYRWNETQCTWGMIKDYQGIDKVIQDEWREKWQL